MGFSNFVQQGNSFLSSAFFISTVMNIVYGILVFLGAILIIFIGNKYIDKLISDEEDKQIRRKNTLMMLLKSILKYTIYFFTAVIILSIFGIPVASLIAGAGILGLAIGFGAQSLVKDVINGFFILFEDQFAVGDYVEAAGKDGLVEELGLRTTIIRNFAGQKHIIPNGEIGQVTNYSEGKMRVLVDVGITYEENPSYAIDKLNELCEQIAKEKADILMEGPKVLGVQELADSSVVLRILAKVKPMEQWYMGRYIKQRVKEYLDEVGIDIAYPHLIVLPKENESLEVNVSSGGKQA
ncbi:MAG: mechanosensitive ion channel family protein [Halanaerobiales bacterium]